MPNSIRALSSNPAPEDVWKVLRSQTTHVPPDLSAPEAKPERHYQIFEVVAASLMKALEPSFDWVATPVGKDNGVDFRGTLDLIKGSDATEPAVIFIGGQCKILERGTKGKTAASIGNGISWDLVRMKRGLGRDPSLFLAMIIYDLSGAEIEDITGYLREVSDNIHILARKSVERLIAQNLDKIREDMEKCLSDRPDAAVILKYFEDLKPPTNQEYALEVDLAEASSWETGKAFEVIVKVHSPIPLDRQCAIVFKPRAFGAPWTRDHQPFELISPGEALTSEGSSAIRWKGKTGTLRLRLIGYIPGTHSPGSIGLTVENSEIIEEPVPDIALADTFSPSYFETESLKRFQHRFEGVFDRVCANTPQCIAVMGAGGSGKTHFTQRMALRSQAVGALYIAAPHPKTHDAPYQIICGIIRSLVSSETGEDIFTWEEVHAHLSRLNSEFASKVENTLRRLFSRTDHVGSGQDTNIQGQILLMLLTARRDPNPLILHLSDLHWCHPAVLSMLGETIANARTAHGLHRRDILLVLEGRSYERATAEAFNDMTSASEFHRTAASFADEVMALKPMTDTESNAFVEHLIGLRASPGRSIPERFFARRKSLAKQILRFSNGNPFHIIEVVRYLKDREILFVDQISREIYLGETDPQSGDVPDTLASLIELRILFWEREASGVGALLQALTFLSDQIDFGLFERLWRTLAPAVSLSDLRKTEFISIPKDRISPIRFKHELYFQLLRERNVLTEKQRNSGVEQYVEWLDARPFSLQVALDKSIVLEQSACPDVAAIEAQVRKGAVDAASQSDTLMETRLLGKLVGLWGTDWTPVDQKELLDRASLTVRFCDVEVVHGDRVNAANHLRNLITIVETNEGQSVATVDWQVREELHYQMCNAVVSLANAYLGMFAAHKSVQLLDEYLPTIRDAAEHEEDSRNAIGTRRWGDLLCRAVNRLGTAVLSGGNQERAETLQKEAVGLAQRLGNRDLLFEAMHDLGDTIALAEPLSGMDILAHAMNQARTANDSQRRFTMAQMTWFGALVRSWCTVRPGSLTVENDELRSRRAEIREALRDCKKNEFSQAISMATLLLGVLYAVDGEYQTAEEWFMASVRANAEARRYENLWKAHLNLAELLSLTDKENQAAAMHHAENAQRLIVGDLKGRSHAAWEGRFRRQARPLAHLVEIWGRLQDPRDNELREQFPALNEGLQSNAEGKLRVLADWSRNRTPCVVCPPFVLYVH